ncbi:MAG: hypothetical protein HY674_02360 [Chloroflexi bacterium]|nr:hypothetical protein [Chloroflexota bacterium]
MEVDSDLAESRTFPLPQRELLVVQPRSTRPSKPDATAQRIIRKHFVETTLDDLRRMQDHSGQPSASNYVQHLFKTIRQARDIAGSDPFLAVLIALHDALAYENRWADYSASQYDGALHVLAKYANQDVFPEKIEKAIMELEDLGFDTTPFAVITDDAE